MRLSLTPSKRADGFSFAQPRDNDMGGIDYGTLHELDPDAPPNIQEGQPTEPPISPTSASQGVSSPEEVEV